jgi:tRNA (guanine37-N1)-methyltransferase
MLQATVLTLFPEMFPGPLGHSITGRALKEQLWRLTALNIRDFAADKHHTVDDTPYGGGAGMVMRPDVVAAAIRHARHQHILPHPGEGRDTRPPSSAPKVIYLSPAGPRFTQAKACELSQYPGGLIILCGHYEGIDERVLEAEVDEVISLGDFVLSGGEPAAVCLLDAVVRLLPGVLGGAASLHEESFDLADESGQPLVEYPHYTRPPVWEGREVPAVLQNGHHAEIKKWRLEQAKTRTRNR